MKMKGKAWKFGDDVNTDLIIPARYLNTSDHKELGQHCMEDADPEFVRKVGKGDFIVGGKNFGCGSSREHAPIAIKACGVSAVIAKDFARIFFRNSINMGVPLFESEEASKGIEAGDELEVDADTGVIRNLTKKREYRAKPLPGFAQEIIKAGGLLNYVKRKGIL